MSEKETAKIDALEKKVENLEQKVDKIYLALQGDKSLNIEGLSATLSRHMKESNENFITLKNELTKSIKTYRYDLAAEFATTENNINEKLIPLKKEVEEQKKYRYRNLGIFGGVMFVVGNFVHYIWELLKD